MVHYLLDDYVLSVVVNDYSRIVSYWVWIVLDNYWFSNSNDDRLFEVKAVSEVNYRIVPSSSYCQVCICRIGWVKEAHACFGSINLNSGISWSNWGPITDEYKCIAIVYDIDPNVECLVGPDGCHQTGVCWKTVIAQRSRLKLFVGVVGRKQDRL